MIRQTAQYRRYIQHTERLLAQFFPPTATAALFRKCVIPCRFRSHPAGGAQRLVGRNDSAPRANRAKSDRSNRGDCDWPWENGGVTAFSRRAQGIGYLGRRTGWLPGGVSPTRNIRIAHAQSSYRYMKVSTSKSETCTFAVSSHFNGCYTTSCRHDYVLATRV